MTRQEILQIVYKLILETNSALTVRDVAESASLMSDLGMDSFCLESLISRTREEVADIEFTPWYVRAARHGQDTVSSLVDYVVERQHQARATKRPGSRAPAEAAAVSMAFAAELQ